MSKETERLFRKITEAIEKQGPASQEETQRIIDLLINDYNRDARNGSDGMVTIEEKSEEFLEKAINASTVESARRYVGKALKLNPDNYEAKVFQVSLMDDEFNKIHELDKIINVEEDRLRNEGFFKDEGEFWLILETRPFMRSLSMKREILESQCRITEAVEVAERMIKLCNNDNLGVRFNLMSYYALLGDSQKAEKLRDTFPNNEVCLLLPYSVCLFRTGRYAECREILDVINKQNPHFAEMMSAEIFDEPFPGYYSPGKETEILAAVNDCRELLLCTMPFFSFVRQNNQP